MTLFKGYFHQWYLFLIIGLYLIIPLLRRITESRETTVYCLVVCCAFSIVIPEAVALLKYFKPPLTSFLTEVLDYWHVNLRFSLTGTGILYMVLGWYLHKYGLPEKLCKLLWVLAAAACALRVVSILVLEETGLPVPYLVGDLLTTAGMFLLGREVLSRRSPRWDRLIGRLSKATFGIYLSHMIVLYAVDSLLGHAPLPIHPALFIPLMTLVVVSGSFVVTAVLGKIPVLGKYIV